MALSKTIDTDYAVPATYWKLLTMEFDWLQLRAMAILAGFPSKEARDAGARPIALRSFSFQDEGFSGFGHAVNNTEVAYAKVKTTNPEFEGATDV